MTGPRIPLVHPHRRRGRRLLPFLAVISLMTPLACTSDQPTEPVLPQANTAAFASASASKVLLLADADGSSTDALAASLTSAGFEVVIRPAPEYTWSGTNPSLNGFDAVVHLNGFTGGAPVAMAAQNALRNFVEFGGGGYVAAQWNGAADAADMSPGMRDLVLLGFGGQRTGSEESCPVDNVPCAPITYSTVSGQEGHPVLAGIPSSFTFQADGHDAGTKGAFETDPSSVLMQVSSGGPAVLVRQLGAGRVVNFSFAPNHDHADGDGATLLDPNVQKLYVNAVRWSARPPVLDSDGDGIPDNGDNCPNVANPDQSDADEDGIGDVCEALDSDGDGIAEADDNCPFVANADQADRDSDGMGDACDPLIAQTIVFNQLADKNLGDPPFSVSAFTSAGLPVSFTASGQCTIAGSTVALTAAGTCTVTAHQAGDLSYAPAQDVAWSFTIHQSVPTLNFAGFFQPVENLPAVNTVSAGRTIPVKFSLGGDKGLGILEPGSPTSSSASCSATSSLRSNQDSRRHGHGPKWHPANAVLSDEESSTDGSLSYDRSSSKYIYLWKTSSSWAGTCRKLVVTLVDGTQHEALFKFSGEQELSSAKRVTNHKHDKREKDKKVKKDAKGIN
jgi:thrombospondin type 3 repeat protein